MRTHDLLSFEQLLEGPGKGFSAGALASLQKHIPNAPKEPADMAPPHANGWISAGCVVVPSLTTEGLGQTYLRKPANGDQGYGTWTISKGKVDAGETPTQAARREVAEEIGLTVSLLPDGYLGVYKGSYSNTHVYMAVQASKAIRPHDAETEAIKLVTFAEALTMATNPRDKQILNDALAWIGAFKKKHNIP